MSILFFYVNVLQLFYDNFVYLLKQEHKIFTVNIYENEKINDNAIYTRNASVEHASGMRRLDDHYSTNPTYRLSFSTDTLAFDTIFSTIGSTTRQFMIYNKNSEPLSIESIMLASGEATAPHECGWTQR